MAKHAVPKKKTPKSKLRIRHNAFMKRTQKKLFGVVDKMKGLEKKGKLELRKKKREQIVKKVKA
jgi:hypothetical protein